MLSVWANVLITLAVCLAGGGFVCLMFALGMKHGIRDALKRHKNKE